MSYLLEIQVPAIHDRQDQALTLVNFIEAQINTGFADIVRVTMALSPRGRPVIGDKRYEMYMQSEGLYTVQIDDDDKVPHDYVETIVPHLREDWLSIGYYIDCEINGEKSKAVVSGKYTTWEHDLKGEFKYRQSPYCKIPILTKACQFAAAAMKGISFGEDAAFSRALQRYPRFDNPFFHFLIEKTLYNYVTQGRPRTWYEGK